MSFEIRENVLCKYREEKGITDIVIPEGVTKIGSSAFEYCRSLTNVEIPEGVTEIEGSAFYGCRSLTSIEIPDSVTKIGDFTFAYCRSLTSIEIPEGVTTIERAFYGCNSLKSKKSAYKAFKLLNGGLVCRNYFFEEGEWSEPLDNIEPCKRGYHYCENLFEVFNFYWGNLDENIAIYECDVGDEVINTDTSKCCTNMIKPVKRLSRQEIINILNRKEA